MLMGVVAPLGNEVVVDLITTVPTSLRVLGIDTKQFQSSRMAREAELPASMSIGLMLPWGPFYAKLMPASQLQRAKGCKPLEGDIRTQRADVLVVAFSASQAVPEWLKLLGGAIPDRYCWSCVSVFSYSFSLGRLRLRIPNTSA